MKIIRHNDSAEYFRGVHDGYEAGVDDGFDAARKALEQKREVVEPPHPSPTATPSPQGEGFGRGEGSELDGMIRAAATYELKWVRKQIEYYRDDLARQTMTPADQREGQLKGLGAAVAIIDRELELCEGKYAPAGNPRREEG